MGDSIIHNVLPLSAEVGVIVKVPLHGVNLTSDIVSGEAVVGVASTLPADG